MKTIRTTRGDKKEAREEMHLTRPPRLEGAVKNAMMYTKKKKKKTRSQRQAPRKPQGISAKQRKDYQRKGPKH